MQKQILISAVSIFILAQAWPAQSADPKAKADVSELLTALKAEKYAYSREGIIELVEEIGDREPIFFLVEQLQSNNRRRRCKAALALELLGDRRGAPAIIKELNDTSYRPTTMIRSDGTEYQEGQVRSDRYYAALLLGILGDKRAVSALIEASRDETIDYQAAISLGRIGDRRAIPALHAMLKRHTKKTFPRLFAGYGLAMLGDKEGLKVVIDTLNDQQQHWVDRRHAIKALGQLGAKQAVPHLIAALKDKHPNIRVSAARALGLIGDVSALPALEEALKDKTQTKVNAPTTVSKAAAGAIAQIKRWGEAVNALRAAVEFVPEKETYSLGREVNGEVLGEKIGTRFHIQNVSGKTVNRFQKIGQGVKGHGMVEDAEGNKLRFGNIRWGMEWRPDYSQVLRPNEIFTLDGPEIDIRGYNKYGTTGRMGGTIIYCKPGLHFIKFNLTFDTGVILETGKRELVIGSTSKLDKKTNVELKVEKR